MRSDFVDPAAVVPAYQQVLAKLRTLALSIPWSEEPMLPPEPALMQRFNISRGTLRRATEELAREGLVRALRGRGTFVSRDQQVRLTMVDVMQEHSLPDSRWHLDLTRFVPDFEGSSTAIAQIVETDVYATAKTVFVTPDNSVTQIVERALVDGKDVLMPTYGLRRGIILLRHKSVRASDRAFAATLDGLERFGTALQLPELRRLRIDLIISGALAVSAQGRIFNSVDAYLQFECALLGALNPDLSQRARLFAVIHDEQLLEVQADSQATAVMATDIFTPTRHFEIGVHPDAAFWALDTSHANETVAYWNDARRLTREMESPHD